MKKTFIGLSAAGSLLAASALLASAATPPSVSCTGTAATSSIMWSATTSGGIAPVSVLWSNGSTSTTQTVSATPGTYALSVTATDASSSVATSSCSAVVTAPAPTTTPIVVPVKQHPSLNINQQGNFVGRDMKVLSVGSGSFTAMVWGITYTVTSSATVTVGDLVDVKGRISTSSPMTVTAQTVRDHPSQITITPKMSHENDNENSSNSQGNENQGNGHSKGKSKGKGKGHTNDQ